jgi:hypothetical protein
MAKYPIGIDIQTTRSGTGAQAVENDLREIRQKAEEVRVALDGASDKMPGGPKDRARLTEMADKLDKVAVKGEQLAVVQNKGAKSTRHGGLAFLEFSRAVAISRRKIQRELEEVEASAQDQITQVTEARLQTLKNIAKTEQDILAHDQQTEKIKAELNELRVKEAEAARLNKRADDALDGPIDKIMGRDNALADRNNASQWFSADDSARLNQIVKAELPGVQAATESAKSKLTELEQELKDRHQDIRLVGNETDVLIENARGIADQQTDLAEIETTNRELSQGAQEFSASLGQLEGLSKTVSEARQGDKATVETLAALMQEVTADGIVTQQELTRINTIVTQSALHQGQATTETAAAVRNLQEVTRTLMNEVRQMKAGQIQISRTGTR